MRPCIATCAIAAAALALACSDASTGVPDAAADIEAVDESALDGVDEAGAPDEAGAEAIEVAPDPSMEASDSAPETPSGDLGPDACVPDCAGKECGPDGCGGSCGYCGCADVTKPWSNCDRGHCLQRTSCVQCTLPTTWSKVGVVATLATPGSDEAEFIETQCPDFSGDGKGDNGLKAFATTINPEFQKALDAGDLGIIFEFRDVTDFVNTAPFTLVGLIGAPDATDATKYVVDPSSYRPDTPSGECAPLIAFDAAKIASGALMAGPSQVVLSIPVETLGGLLAFTLEDTQVKATITDDDVNATDGVIGGVYTKAQYDALVAKLMAQCVINPTDVCEYLKTRTGGLGFPFDLDLNKDGKKDAASICFKFTLKAGTIVGLKP